MISGFNLYREEAENEINKSVESEINAESLDAMG